ncbi:TPA: Ig-like domain-containing protein, partial [Morganella morganii]|nr:Ig-like domain-containing protein [Morganella morganii]
QASSLNNAVTVPNAAAKAGGSWTESGEGTYTGLYVAQTVSADNEAVLQPGGWATGVTSGAYAITVDSSSAQVSMVTLNDDTQSKVADGISTFTYTALVEDSNGNPVPGVTVNWFQDKGTAVTLPPTSITDSMGIATITLTSTLVLTDDIQVKAQYLNTPSVDANKIVNFTYGEAALITIAAMDGEKTVVVGEQPALTLVIQDVYGHDIPSQTLNLSISGNQGGTPSIYPNSVTSNTTGGISTNPLITDNTAEIVTITATLSGSSITGTFTIKFVPDMISLNTSTIVANPVSIQADGKSISTVIYTPKDKFGNAITDISPSSISSVILGMSDASLTLSPWSFVNNQYVATITSGTKTGRVRVIPVVNGTDGVSRTGENILALVAGELDVNQSSIKAVPSTIVSDDKSTSILQFIPKDSYGNVISTLNESSISQIFSGEATDMKVGAWSYDANSQWYSAILTAGSKSGMANIMPTIDGQDAAGIGVTNTLALSYLSSVKDIEVENSGIAIADGIQTNLVTVTIYGENNQVKSGIAVNITPSNSELLINGRNAIYTGTTNTQGQLTVPMSSTLIGDNNFIVESDQYSEIGVSSFGIYVSPTLSSVSFDTVDLYNNGKDIMTVTFNPVDAKGRTVSGLDVTFSSTDVGATLTSSDYKAEVKSRSAPSTYLISIVMTNYSSWQPTSEQYELIPESGVRLAILSIKPKLCGGSKSNNNPVIFDSCSPGNINEFYYSGLGFVIELEWASDNWDKKLNLKSSDITGAIYITPTNGGAPYNCSLPVTQSGSWMNDFYSSNNYSVDIVFNDVNSKFDTYDSPGTGTNNGGAGICDLDWGRTKVKSDLRGKGNVRFEVTTYNPSGKAVFEVPLAGYRIDQGVIPGIKFSVFSN